MKGSLLLYNLKLNCLIFSTSLNGSLIIFIRTYTVNYRNALDRLRVCMNNILLKQQTTHCQLQFGCMEQNGSICMKIEGECCNLQNKTLKQTTQLIQTCRTTKSLNQKNVGPVSSYYAVIHLELHSLLQMLTL